jgi:D-glycero-D-manno-heptose 1,7-bisphosphate phosphatase
LPADRVAVFLDRDGTINVDRGWTHRVLDLEFLPGAAEAIRLLNEARLLVIVVTNQSGVGRGFYTEEDVEKFHEHMNAELSRQGAQIDAFYYCPHHPTEAKGQYLIRCQCRKPGPALIERAIKDWNIDLTRSYVIGDDPRDIEAGRRVGLATVQLTSGPTEADHTASDLLAAARLILKLNRAR